VHDNVDECTMIHTHHSTLASDFANFSFLNFCLRSPVLLDDSSGKFFRNFSAIFPIPLLWFLPGFFDITFCLVKFVFTESKSQLSKEEWIKNKGVTVCQHTGAQHTHIFVQMPISNVYFIIVTGKNFGIVQVHIQFLVSEELFDRFLTVIVLDFDCLHALNIFISVVCFSL